MTMPGQWLRREYARLLTSGAQLLLVIVGVRLDSRGGWLACLAGIALVSLFAWLSALYRLRAIRDTPTSKIASAAQGYVELVGSGGPFCDPPLFSQLRGLPCLWCRYRVEERTQGEWKTVDHGETTTSFMLRDGTGECAIDPENAEIITRHCDQWHDDNKRYTEWSLLTHDVLHVIGQFQTHGASTLAFDTRAEMSALLAQWKTDMPALLARFDLNQDGQLDMNEWELARAAARREVDKMRMALQTQPDFHTVSQPSDGQLFLISNLSQDRLSRRYLVWAWIHVLILAVSFGALVWGHFF